MLSLWALKEETESDLAVVFETDCEMTEMEARSQGTQTASRSNIAGKNSLWSNYEDIALPIP